MPSNTLKKALQGDEYSLILMTELIGTKKVSGEDAEFIRNSKLSNENSDYLHACLKAWGVGASENLLAAKHLLKPLTAKGNSFASNLLSIIYRLEGEDNKNRSHLYAEQALKANNPLAVLNYLLSENKLKTVITSAPQIYHRLSPFYQHKLLEEIQKHYSNLTISEDFYQFARCFEKMNLLPQMYQSFHKAIEFCDETGSKYQRKFVKTLEKQANSTSWGVFKIHFDYSYLSNRLSDLKKNLTSLDKAMASYSVGKQKEIEESKEKLKEIGLTLKNYKYIIQEKAPGFKVSQQQSLYEQLQKTLAFYETMSPTISSSEQQPHQISKIL